MYTKRIQIMNYGPIDHFDILFPFQGDLPKPVVMVGENGTGKSIVLSHLVNSLISGKDMLYPETPEVDTGKVYKLRASSYIKIGRELYFSRVDFENDMYVREMRTKLQKQQYENEPPGLHDSMRDAWHNMRPELQDYFDAETLLKDKNQIKEAFSNNCVLYFPANRFEEPAWLNEENLKAHANYMETSHLTGYTGRRIVSHSPLRENQDWIFDLL